MLVACMCAKSLPLCPTLWDLMARSCQAPLSMGFSRQEHWSGLVIEEQDKLPALGLEPLQLSFPQQWEVFVLPYAQFPMD